jgi:hypothetical protein
MQGEPPSPSGAAATVPICGARVAPHLLRIPVSRPVATRGS